MAYLRSTESTEYRRLHPSSREGVLCPGLSLVWFSLLNISLTGRAPITDGVSVSKRYVKYHGSNVVEMNNNIL